MVAAWLGDWQMVRGGLLAIGGSGVFLSAEVARPFPLGLSEVAVGGLEGPNVAAYLALR